MKSALFGLFISLWMLVAATSCTKTEVFYETRSDTLRQTDTLQIVHTDTVNITRTDTLTVAAKDTVFVLNVANWDFFINPGFATPGATTYLNTADGIKFFGQAYRYGGRLQVKKEIGFKDKTVFFKWKANGGGQFTDVVISIKYIPTSGDGTPALQGIDLENFTTDHSYNGSIVLQPDAWYYTQLIPLPGSDTYQVVTATGNYATQGGQPISSKLISVFTKHGYPAIRLGDPFGGAAAYAVLGECKIAD